MTAVYVVAAASAIQVLANGGDIGQALVAGFTSFASSFITMAVAPANFGFNIDTLQFIATSAVVGGVSASLNGGSFGAAFRGAGLGAMLGGAVAQNSGFGRSLGQTGRGIARVVVGGTLSKTSGGKFANGAAYAAFAAIVSSAATPDEVALDEGEGISGSITAEERALATERMEEVLNVAEANGDEMTATYARRALGHGLQFDESMTAAATVYVGRGEADQKFGRITIGKSFFLKGTNPELAENFPVDAEMLSSQSLRVQQLFRLRHEVAHMSYANRRIMGYGPRAMNPQEIDASRQAFEWTKRYIIDAQ